MDDRTPKVVLQKLYSLRDRFEGFSREDLIFRGNFGWIENDLKLAEKNYSLMVELYPDDRACYYYYGLLNHYLKHDFETARSFYDQAYALTPEYLPITRDLAYLVKGNGRNR